MNDMNTLRIGIVGLGGIATRMHIPALMTIPDVCIEASAEINPQQAERTQRRFSIPRIYDSYDAMFDQEQLDAVYICLPNFLHVDAVHKALDHRLHVLCEKPMGLSAIAAADMAELALDCNCLLLPGYNMRYVPNYLRARELIRSRRLGRILQIHATVAKPGPYTGWDPKSYWYYDRDNIGVLYDLGSHAVDLIRYVCRVEITDVCAQAVTTLPGLEVTDSIVAAFSTDGYAVGTINITWGAPANVDMITVHGTAGSLIVSWNYFEHLKPGSSGLDKLMTFKDNTAAIVKRVSRSILRLPLTTDSYLSLAQDFTTSVRNGTVPAVSAHDAVRVLEVLERIADTLPETRRRELYP